MSGDTTSPARSVAEAAYRELEKQRETDRAAQAAASARGEEMAPAPLRRLRLARGADGMPTVDLSKADKRCSRCGGTGRRADQRLVDEEAGEERGVPVICMCVHRNGGVATDMLDRMLADAEKKH